MPGTQPDLGVRAPAPMISRPLYTHKRYIATSLHSHPKYSMTHQGIIYHRVIPDLLQFEEKRHFTCFHLVNDLLSKTKNRHHHSPDEAAAAAVEAGGSRGAAAPSTGGSIFSAVSADGELLDVEGTSTDISRSLSSSAAMYPSLFTYKYSYVDL